MCSFATTRWHEATSDPRRCRGRLDRARGEALLPASFTIVESTMELIENELQVRIHGAEITLLSASIVVIIGDI